LKLAEIVVDVWAPTIKEVAVNVADVAFAATVTFAGTVAAAVLVLASVRTAPEAGAGPFRVTVAVEFATPPSTVVGAKVTETMDGAFTVKVADCGVVDPRAAEIDTPDVTPTASGVTVKVADVANAGTFTLAGTVAMVLSPLVNVTIRPPGGAVPFNVTDPVEVCPEIPPRRAVGLRETLVTAVAKGNTVRVTPPLPFSVAVIIDVVGEATDRLVTVNVPELAPSGMFNGLVTVAAPVLPLTSVTLTPPAGAGPVNVTVPVELVVPPTTVAGFRETVATDGGETTICAVVVPL